MTLQIIQNRKIYLSISIVLIAASIVFLALWGLRPGIDFTGGSLLNLRFTQERPAVQDVNALLKGLNFQSEISVQPAGNANFVLRFQKTDRATYEKIMSAFKEKYPNNAQEESFESIGPSVGQEIKTKAVYAIILSVIAIMIYIAWAFRKVSWPVSSWKYATAAIIALVHDIIIPLGVFAFLGKFYNVEVGLPFVAALLTILGYSVNDTIVIFDRTRENLTKTSKFSFEELVNRSINETLVRSVNTVMTVLIALFAVLIFGGASVRYFALALIIGVASGCYSSIFIASPIVVMWEKWDREKALKKS